MTETIDLKQFSKRQYFLDWLRVLAFAYLVFYHTGMMFVEWPFHIESGHDSRFLKSIMMLTSNWRLDLLFLVSGVAISVMTVKMTLTGFLKQRLVKLFVPLFFACAVVVAPQPYFEALQKGFIEPGYWQFWSEKYFHFTWLDGMLSPWPTYNHMWYVAYLFLYTILLIPVIAYINSKRGITHLAKFENWLNKGARILWAPYLIYIPVYFYNGNNEVTHNIIKDNFGHFIFAYILIMGVLFVRMPSIWQAFEDNRYKSMILAFLSYCLIMIKYNWDTPLDIIPWDLVEMIIKWSWIAMLIGFARRYLNFSNDFLQYGNGIVYPFYILHQTVLIIIGYYIIDWGMNGIFEYLAIAMGTFIICLLLIEFVIKKSNFLRLLFGVRIIKKERATKYEARSST